MASLMDRFEERVTAFHMAAMRAALLQEHISNTAAACRIRTIPAPTAYLSEYAHLRSTAREDCCTIKNRWHKWFLDMQTTRNLTLAPVYYADMEEVLAVSAERGRDLLRAWGRRHVVATRCGMAMLTLPLAGRRILIAEETVRLYALRNVFMD